ncbi:hypothetical protein [Bacillus cereus]|uniref:hypothetical protein n=1 Tax=Bacillus cereus TaxID=1396 RepID=UPI0020D27273|nr:hypothetical protein [Bacillus cereus]
MKSRIETISLFLSVGIIMMLFMYQVYDNLFAKDDEMRRSVLRENEKKDGLNVKRG